MNVDWANFLQSINLSTHDEPQLILNDDKQSQNCVCATTHLSIIKVTGSEATQFLQGQLTCNIKELNESKSFFSAFCSAKGRTITTLLIVKTSNSYLLVLPSVLVDKVTQKLQMYIMRADVQLHKESENLCLIGLQSEAGIHLPNLPETTFSVYQNSDIYIKLPGRNRYLVISSSEDAIALWNKFSRIDHYTACHLSCWIEQDISAGIPWLTQETSEEYIPQMLNIDKLGGISFNKGCYTGQEIIARTHYLGKTKRELCLAYCEKSANISCDSQIMANNSEQTVGKVLSLQTNNQHIKMLIVMQKSDEELKNLRLNNLNQDKIHLIDFQ